MVKAIIAGMATIPGRTSTLPLVLNSICPQVDLLELSLNGFERPPEFLQNYPNIKATINSNEMGDANKFYSVEKYPNAYYFSCDDDIIYPEDYVDTYLSAINRTKGLVTVHGSNINRKVLSYYRGKTMMAHCLNECHEVAVHIPGSGVSAFDTSQLKVKYSRFAHPNMADIFLGIQCQEQGVKRTAIAHKSGWIKGGLNEGRPTIYECHKSNDFKQTNLVNSKKWT